MKKDLLPGRRVFGRDITYFIHGMVHGNPWVRIKSSFKKELSRLLRDVPVLCEDGFVSWVPTAISMDEARYFGIDQISLLERLRFLGLFIFSSAFRPPRRKEPKIISDVKGMESVEDLQRIREELFGTYLPEPEGMNLVMERSGSGEITTPRGEVPLRIRRYVYEAKTAQDYAQINGLEELHLLVGCAHELPLEYLLNHPDILEKYAL